MKKNGRINKIRAGYPKWLEKARKSTDVERITKLFMEKGDFFEDLDFEDESIAWKKIYDLMESKNYTFEDVEKIMLEYSGTIHTIYAEMGIKAGFRLQTDSLYNSIYAQPSKFKKGDNNQ